MASMSVDADWAVKGNRLNSITRLTRRPALADTLTDWVVIIGRFQL
jgi:hypothetical protein